MTGYAVVAADISCGRLGVEIRSINGRHLDLQLRIPEDLRAHEALVRERLSARLVRGKVDCRLTLDGDGGAAAHQILNAAALAALERLSDEVRRKFPDAAPLRVADVLRWPGVLVQESFDDKEIAADIATLCDRAIDELLAARLREGARLETVLRERLARMRQAVADVAPAVPQALAAYRERLTLRLREALGAADDERIRTEIAVFAGKIDIDEELTRLVSHIEECERTLGRGDPAGKRLEFLTQELGREANTLASKAADPRIGECALEIKVLIEQLREQVQNIE